MDEKTATTAPENNPATENDDRNPGHVLADILDCMATCHPLFAEKSKALRDEFRAALP